jgi:sporulation protein YlmC with PRC-barrel domain
LLPSMKWMVRPRLSFIASPSLGSGHSTRARGLLAEVRMLHKVRDLQGDAILAEDGEVGSVDDLYFDDEGWDVRYLVVNTRRWIPGRKILVSPIAIDRERPLADGDIRVELTRAQIARCPTVAAGGANLRSSVEVIGCGIEARDGAIGSVADLVIDDQTWEITDVLVDSREWLPGRLILISPGVIERIDWPEKKVHLRLARQDILQAPEVRL